MKKVLCHIRIGEKTLYDIPTPLFRGLFELTPVSEYESLNQARKIKRELQKRFYPVYIIRGPCPVADMLFQDSRKSHE